MIVYKGKKVYIKNNQLRKIDKAIRSLRNWLSKNMDIWLKDLSKNILKVAEKYIKIIKRNQDEKILDKKLIEVKKISFIAKRSITKTANFEMKNIYNSWMRAKKAQKRYGNWLKSNQDTDNKITKMLLEEQYRKDLKFIDKEKYKIVNKSLHIDKYIYIYKFLIQNILALKKIIIFSKNLVNNEQVYIRIKTKYLNTIDSQENQRNIYKYLQKYQKILNSSLEIIPELALKLAKSSLKFHNFVTGENYSLFFKLGKMG